VVEAWQDTDARHPLRPVLAELAADACHLVAYQVFDQGRRGLAKEWYRSAADMAARSGNRDLYVFAACGVAYMDARQGQVMRSLDVLHQTARVGGSATASSYIHAYRGHALLAAQDRDGMLRSLDTAAVLAGHTADQQPPSWLGVTGPDWVQRQRAMLLARLGSPGAVTTLTALQQQTSPLFARFHVTVATDLAHVHTASGDYEAAAAALTTAATLNGRVRSVERARRMRAVRDRLAPTAPTPVLDQVDDALRSAAQTLNPARPHG
jgi:hypothetical protein